MKRKYHASYPKGAGGRPKQAIEGPAGDSSFRGFSSRNYVGECPICGLPKKDHLICQACGIFVGLKHENLPTYYKKHVVCGPCFQRWERLDKLMRAVLGREASWLEIVHGIPGHILYTYLDKFPFKSKEEPEISIIEEKGALTTRDLDLSVGTWNMLRRNNIEEIDDLISKTVEDLLGIRAIGPARLAEIKEALKRKGLVLKNARPIKE